MRKFVLTSNFLLKFFPKNVPNNFCYFLTKKKEKIVAAQLA